MSERMSIRFVRSYDVKSDEMPRSINVWYGNDLLNPWMCRWYEFLWHPVWLWRKLTRPSPFQGKA